MTKKEFLKRDFSKEPLKNYSWSKTDGSIFPNFSFDLVLDLIETDPVARGAINHFVDKCMEGDYSIVRKEDRTYDRLSELRLEENFMFRTKILRKIFLMGKLFNNVFVEIVRDSDGRTKSLNILDTTNVKVNTEPNGDPITYESKIQNPHTKEFPLWEKDDISWIKFGDRTVGWAPVDMRAVFENLQLKYYVKRYVAWLWKTGQYRVLYNFNKSSNQDIEDFLTYTRKHDRSFDVPFVGKGDIKTALIRDMRETSSLVELLSYLDSQTLILLRIPPIDAGIPDASGRSNADAQANNIESTVLSTKKTVEDYINFDLFPKINRSTIMLVFGPMNRFAIKQYIELAKSMKDMGMKDEAIKEFLEDWGLFWGEKELFNKPEVNPVDASFNGKSDNGNTKDFGEKNQPQDEVTTREDQLKKV